MTRDFSKRVGNVFIPVADAVAVSDQPVTSTAISPISVVQPTVGPTINPQLLTCKTTLKEGCYTISYVPNTTKTIFGPRYAGTLRVENLGGGSIRFSGDLYSAPFLIVAHPNPPIATLDRVERIRMAAQDTLHDSAATDSGGVIPIRARKNYYSYLKGKAANLTSIRLPGQPCSFSLDFDEFKYNQPASGFSGSFPAAPTRSLRFSLASTATPDLYTGKLLTGTTELGSLSIQWISPNFRRATLQIYRLNGADNPPSSVPKSGGGTEDFGSVFNSVNWDLSFSFVGDIPLPPALVGVQDPNQCWSQANCATLMSSIPGYNAADLDNMWRVYLIAIPAKLGCSRGQMFDTGSGNPDGIPREGSVTNSRDGYPTADSTHFGVAQNGLQKDFPRAFLRSASHEVGHAFNQIHQEFEGGADNSIMTTTPSVADVLFSQGKSFPNDIILGFNATVRRHLVHLPDPAVRPGAIDFFGAAVNGPQADEIAWPNELTLTTAADNPSLALGEALALSWTLTNNGPSSAAVPTKLDIESLTARVSVTDSNGNTVFLRPAEQHACVHNPLRELKPGEKATGGANVYWGRDGFTFSRPGRYTVDVTVMWQISGMWVAASAETAVWVSFPASDEDNRVASLMLHPEVGRAVAAPHAPATEHALKSLAEAKSVRAEHPAIVRLKALGHAKRLKLE